MSRKKWTENTEMCKDLTARELSYLKSRWNGKEGEDSNIEWNRLSGVWEKAKPIWGDHIVYRVVTPKKEDKQ